MDWNELFIYVSIITLALAIFAIGFPFLPFASIFRFFSKRKPKRREIAVIGRFLGMMSLLALVVLMVYIPLTIVKFSFMVAGSIAATITCHQMLARNIIVIILMVIIFGALVWLFKYLWKKSKGIKFPPTDTQKMTTELRGLRRDLKQLIEELREKKGIPPKGKK